MSKYLKLLLIALALNVALWVAILIYGATLCSGYICRG